MLLVYRDRYEDWTFPKGKVKRGESDEQAALREVREETGLSCTLGSELASTSYRDPKLRMKTVRYWAMGPAEGEARPCNEVDKIAWLTQGDAADRLTYARDLEVLRSFRAVL